MTAGTHDAASVVAGLAGLGPQVAVEPLPPAALIKRFDLREMRCPITPAAGGGDVASSRYVGFCGHNGRSGYDDGYDFIGELSERGWRPLAEKGDWPLVVYMVWRAGADGEQAIAEYCEADLTVWTFDHPGAARAFYDALRDCP